MKSLQGKHLKSMPIKARIYCVVLFCVTFYFAPLSLNAFGAVREAAVAGSFYPSDANQLRQTVDHFLAQTVTKSVKGDIKVLIVPHAGYVYSGPVAAEAYTQIKGKTYDAVVIIASSHFVAFDGASIFDGEGYETPLGTVPIHVSLVERLKERNSIFSYVPAAHKREHSLEVHLPFLQEVLGDFKLIPIVVGQRSPQVAQIIGLSLAEIARDHSLLVIASTDLSHYKNYADAVYYDTKTVNTFMQGSADNITEYFGKNHDAACGQCPVMAAFVYADAIGADTRTLLRYANSGDTAGNKSKVVGYSAIAISKKGDDVMTDTAKPMISKNGQQELFMIVRKTIKEYLTDNHVSDLSVANAELQAKRGVFVTLHTKEGALRGCIGNFISHEPLYKTVQQMALAAAFRDPRFPPVRLEELDDITIEVSVLSPMEKVDDVNTIELGKHGIYIKKGLQSGTFLPQVATETGWSLEEFLGHCARDKAGIGWEGWKDAEVYSYAADVYSEH